MQMIDHEGFVIDSETGEILEYQEGFHITNRESAEWVLEKMQDCDSQLTAIRAKENAILSNLQKQKNRIENKKKFFQFRFGQELENWARKELENKKEKSVVTPYGILKFRKSKPKVVIKDYHCAERLIEDLYSTLISWEGEVKYDFKGLLKEIEDDVLNGVSSFPGIEIEEERETFKIDTGVTDEKEISD